MSGTCWRLLAAFLLILIAALLRGQDAAADRVGMLTPDSVPLPLLVPNAPERPFAGPPFARYPVGPQPYPIGRNPIVVGPIVFSEIIQAAGIIFSGQVTSVARNPSPEGAVSTAVTFKVERAMRGATVGHELTIHEWSGLWSRGERYRVGERVLLFLYSPSRLGLTSPVAGPIGRFAIKSDGRVVMTPQHIQILRTNPLLSGKTVVPYADFSLAVQRSSREE